MNVPMVVGPVIVETCVFFLMQYFWLPPTSPLILGRLAILCLQCFPGIAEWYWYCTNKEVKRLGGNTWLLLVIIVFEVLICFKFGRVVFPEFTIPVDIWGPWAAFLLLHALWLVLFFGLKQSPSSPLASPSSAAAAASTASASSPAKAKKKPLWKAHWLDFLFFLSFSPLLLLCRLWAWK